MKSLERKLARSLAAYFLVERDDTVGEVIESVGHLLLEVGTHVVALHQQRQNKSRIVPIRQFN